MTKAFANLFSTNATAEPSAAALELVCPVYSLVTLRAAVDNGADWIQLDCCERSDKNNLTGLSFDNAAIKRGIRYAHDKCCNVLLAIEAHPTLATWGQWRHRIDQLAQCGIDAILLSDPALLLYVAAQYPELRLHYSISDTELNCETINFFHKQLGVSRIVLPRVLSLTQISQVSKKTETDLQIVGFGRSCTIVAGGHAAYANASHPFDDSRHSCAISKAAIDCCAISEDAANDGCFVFNKLLDISALKLLPRLATMGIRAVRVEANDRGPVHLAQITRVWREAIDDCLENLDRYSVKLAWISELNKAVKESNSRSM